MEVGTFDTGVTLTPPPTELLAFGGKYPSASGLPGRGEQKLAASATVLLDLDLPKFRTVNLPFPTTVPGLLIPPLVFDEGSTGLPCLPLQAVCLAFVSSLAILLSHGESDWTLWLIPHAFKGFEPSTSPGRISISLYMHPVVAALYLSSAVEGILQHGKEQNKPFPSISPPPVPEVLENGHIEIVEEVCCFT